MNNVIDNRDSSAVFYIRRGRSCIVGSESLQVAAVETRFVCGFKAQRFHHEGVDATLSRTLQDRQWVCVGHGLYYHFVVTSLASGYTICC